MDRADKRILEKFIQERGQGSYLVDVIEKTANETPEGYPLYKTVVMTKVNFNDHVFRHDMLLLPTCWHFGDEAYRETLSDYYTWWETGDRKGILEWYAKHDAFDAKPA
jgi:hypothetical protein